MPELARSGETYAATTLKRTRLAPKAARTFVRDALSTWNIAEDLIWDACLVASELVTNVVRHVPDADELRLCVSTRDGRPLIEVWDPSPIPPEVVDNPDESGRGLKEIVTELSTTWYHTTTPQDPGGGKTVAALI